MWRTMRKSGKYSGFSWWLRQCHFAMRRWWSRVRFGIPIGLNGSMLPSLGKGKYVDVFRRGNCIEIHDHHSDSKPFTIRLIPYQPNHGVMVEYINDKGNVGWRTHCDSRMFRDMGYKDMESQL